MVILIVCRQNVKFCPGYMVPLAAAILPLAAERHEARSIAGGHLLILPPLARPAT